jgi:hypothetical protein
MTPRYRTALSLIVLLAGAVSLFGQTKTVRNNLLELQCDPLTARWSLATVQGLPDLPSDDIHPLTGTGLNSFCIVRIDAVDHKYGSSDGKLTLLPSGPSAILHSWTVNNIEILQELKLTNSSHIVLPGSIKVRYWVRNKDIAAHNIGLRVVLDTFLGANDDAEIIVPAAAAYIVKETTFRSTAVPDWWCSWDSISTPYARAVMSFTSPGTVRPDILAFASRKRLAETAWDFFPDGQKDFRPTPLEPPDPAVGLTWAPIPFRPGRENGVAFQFGFQDASASTMPPLELILVSPVTVQTGVIVFLAEVRNTDPSKAVKNLTVKLVLPSGVSLIANGTAEIKIPELAAAGRTFVSWRVRLKEPGPKEFQCSAAGTMGSEIALNQVKRTVIVR